ncbi:MAG TPA: hypothetical protein VHA52_07825, partial [Candidatus Babeliaceae bacterium]|nr:hypothetical protein [Candidatus Babeliaceae bacterium]
LKPEQPLIVSLSDSDFTDLDLIRLVEAGWFNNRTLNLSNNRAVTAKGLMYIGSKNQLTELDLSHTNLKDDDLRQMAESGHFNHVQKLILCNNPGISAKGLLEWVGKKGFASLEWLNISHNTQFTGVHLQDWMSSEGFTKLEVLELRDTNLTTEDLQQMIERSSWIRNLRGLNLVENQAFRRFPSNILQLTNLAQRPRERVAYFHGCGILINHIFDYIENQAEYITLWKEGKIDGS